MSRDMPEGVRRDLDRQRKQFVTAVGAGFEELLELRVDPSPWMASVVSMLEAVKAAARDSDR